MMIAVILAAVLLTVQDRPVDPRAELAAARTLYASAAYEEALERLSRAAQSEGLLDQVDTYRALCLLALGRTAESERALEQILLRNPSYTLGEDESPRLVVVFQAVRARVLPVSARNLFAAARASYDEQKFDIASAQLQELLILISPANVAESALGLADLRVLAEGFLKLAESMLGPGESLQSPRVPQAGGPDPKAPVYSILNRDVIAPVEISRPVPTSWEAPRGMPKGLYQGLIEVVINERGLVESPRIRKSVSATYDADLLVATAEWRFQPATKNGLPVKYSRSYEVIVHSR